MFSINTSYPALLLSFITVLLALTIACADSASNGEQATTTAFDKPAITQTQTAPTIQGPCFDAELSARAVESLADLADAPGRIAFVCEGQIWTMRPDGSDHVQVTEPTEIAFERVRLNRVPADESPTAEEILDLEHRMNSSPAWQSDGSIIFASIRDTLALSAASDDTEPRPFVGASELYQVNADGSGLQRLTRYNLTPGSYPGQFEPAECISPTFCHAGLVRLTPLAASLEGSQLVLAVSEIHFSECCVFTTLLDLTSGDFKQLTIGPGEPEAGSSIGFSWSGDEDHGVLYLWRGNAVAGPYFEELVARDLETGEDTVLVRAGEGATLGSLGYPAWSPVADLIAFCARSELLPGAPRTVYIINSAGRELKPLATRSSFNEPGISARCQPSWSPDGTYIAVTNGEDGVLVIDSVTGESAVVARGMQPAWRPAD